MKPTVIYDEECPYCVAIAKLVNFSSSFEKTSYDSDKAQNILEEEFEDPGFTFYLVEDKKIYFGDRAAQRTAEKFYRSKIVGEVFLKLYPSLSKLFSVLTRRTEIEQPECSSERCVVNQEEGGIVERTG